MEVLRSSAWLDDANLVQIEIVTWDGGNKCYHRIVLPVNSALALSDKVHHAATSGLRSAPRPRPAMTKPDGL